ncbi:hypothetical protein DSC45_35135 [Streptomyces sp. YIM 130001]|uniref:DUF1702 family protein n=1 Tax=Streptomyces sp. YIM 130001 TaxID=2259644 RepID=UPI000E658C7F|nr:DUF1702 family protein [Streptomyces sp. YIM 130001]RII06883.1 hypothetical protein DSC45_35135 [Streptomyces sp. YIM 130001]
MSKRLRALRRKILTPNVSATELEVRGFHVKSAEAKEQLETIGRTFLQGYGYAVEARSPAEAEEWLEAVDRPFRGFAYEGAGMGAVMLDCLAGSTKRLTGLLAGQGQQHIYMVYVGIGWAMARLPRFLWPDVTRTDPLLRWLILDGYGFHQAYFRTDSYVRDPHREHPFSWAGGPDVYSARAIDQGIGRALWFVGGTDPDTVADLIGAYAEHRHADLYAGAGLAATYAGSVSEDELRVLVQQAGEHHAQLAQGAAFAAEAREMAGLTIPHTHLAARVLCDRTPQQAAALCRDLMPAAGDRDVVAGIPAYETWKQQVAAELAAVSPAEKDANS